MNCTKKLLSQIPGMLVIVICFISVSTAKSQIGLTKALDYDGDGKADPTVFRSNGDTWYISKSSNPGSIQEQFGIATLDTLTPGDFDGDGKGDMAIWRESSGTFWYLRSSNNTFATKQLGQAGDEPVARDFDGDGKTDCTVVRRANGYLYWHIFQSFNNSPVVYQYGISTDRPAPGDYDGDGHFDLAVQRNGPGGSLIFYIYQSTLGSTVLQFGNQTDLFVPGDYDGDGKTDLAIARWEFLQANNEYDNYEWWIRKSSDGSVVLVYYALFNAGDIPVQADYDGDGKTDIAVWRSTNYFFYINQSSNGQTSSKLWGTRGDLPVASYDTH